MSTTPTRVGVDHVLLDNRRAPCAVGLIKADRTMATLDPATVLEIWSRDRFAPMEISVWAARQGHHAQDLGRNGTWPRRYFVFEVRKRSADDEGQPSSEE